jgi:hypothetical protein
MTLDDYVKRDEKIRNGKMTRRDFDKLLVKAIGVGAAGGTVATLEKCSSPTQPPPPDTEYDHDFTIEKLQDMETGATITGGTYAITINGQTISNGVIGQKLTLPKTKKKIELCKIVINAPGYFQRTYNLGEVTTGTRIAPTLVNFSFPIADYLTFWPTGQTFGFSSRTMNVSFNQGLGQLPTFVAAIQQPINNDPLGEDFYHQSRVYNWGEYFLNDIRYDLNGQHIIDTTVPPVGDWWAFLRSDIQGTTSASYSSNGIDIIAIKEYINPASAAPGDATRETKWALLRVPGIADYPQVPQWMRLRFNRPATADYIFGLGGESQNGFDARSKSTPTSDVSSLGSMVNMKLIDRINSHEEMDPSVYEIPGRYPLFPGDRIPAKNIISYLLNGIR